MTHAWNYLNLPALCGYAECVGLLEESLALTTVTILSSKVSQHVESMLYKKSLSLPTNTKQAFDQPADTTPLLDFNSWGDNTLDIPCSQDITIPKGIERDSVRN